MISPPFNLHPRYDRVARARPTHWGHTDNSLFLFLDLQIERKVAPFWRGLNDFSESWTEPQIIAAARGLPAPPADQTPPEELVPRSLSAHASPSASSQNLNSLTVPLGPRTMSAASDRSAYNAGSGLPSPASSGAPGKGLPVPFKPRTKALAAALSLGSRNGSSSDLTPREVNLPHDPFVNGQPLEVFIYKEGSECPICFLYYPPYLNHTRCCDQPICSECFVQIKRPDPHFPEGHGDQENPEATPEAAEMLISEPAQCPYCQQPEFGVTYDPPPFRRGLSYTISSSALASMNTAMSSNSSLNSASLAPFISPPPSGAGGRRRTQSLSANDPNVITTDRVRPDWAAKLAAQRNHLARRAAAATALHTAAFLMGDQSSRPFSRMSRFGRRNTGGDSTGDNNAGASSSAGATPSGPEPSTRNSSGRGLLAGPAVDRRQSHMESLENMMLAEAIRLSLAAEEDRKRKADKEEKKEAKKKEKEERKAAKAAAKGHPYSGSGQSSASGSTLSLAGLSAIGRRRGNSAASNLRVEATTAHAMAYTGTSSAPPANPNDKGKGVDRGAPQTPPETEVGKANVDALHPNMVPVSSPSPTPSAAPRPVPAPHQSAGPSHLRQMSSASSVSDSQPESQSGSYQDPSYLQSQDPRTSGLSLGGKSDASEDPGARSSGEDESTEPMFNYSSLAQMVGVELEGVNAGRRLSQIGEQHGDEEGAAAAAAAVLEKDADKRSSINVGSGEHVEHASTTQADSENDTMSKSMATITQDTFDGADVAEGSASDQKPSVTIPTPQVMVTPETPSVEDHEAADSKQLGFEGNRTVEAPSNIMTQ